MYVHTWDYLEKGYPICTGRYFLRRLYRTEPTATFPVAIRVLHRATSSRALSIFHVVGFKAPFVVNIYVQKPRFGVILSTE